MMSAARAVTEKRHTDNWGGKSHMKITTGATSMKSELHGYSKNKNKSTPQTSKAKKGQRANSAGGYTFVVNEADRFRRFLILGSEASYYQTATEMTEQSVKFVRRYIEANGVVAVNEIVEVSDQALAPKNTYAIFALSQVFAGNNVEAKIAARAALPKVCRTATHLFEFAAFVRNTGTWSTSVTKAVASWYQNKSADQLAFQTTKYRSRFDFTHRDLMRLSHPVGVNEQLGNYILGREVEEVDALPDIVLVFESLKAAKSEKEVVKILAKNPSATWEMIPTEYHKSAKVWRQLFENGMPQTALIRNATRFARLGLFNDMVFVTEYTTALTDQNKIERGRIHPIQYLNASVVFKDGQVIRDGNEAWYAPSRTKDWESNAQVQSALNKGYELAFKNLVPAEKRTLLGLDVSGSMSVSCSGLDLTCAQATGAMAHMISKTEPYSKVMGFSTQFKDLGISADDSLNAVLQKIDNQTFGRTDCSLPMQYALKNGIEVDTFVVMTDNETYAGSVHPFQALKQYRKESGIDAKLIVVAATATKFTIADPSDAGMLDISGLDSSGPKLIADFSAGRV